MAAESSRETDKSGAQAGSDPRSFMGSFPDVNVEIVSDYKRSQKSFAAPRKFLRIHIDLPLPGATDLEDLRKALEAGNHKAARSIAGKQMGAATPANALARRIIEAALED